MASLLRLDSRQRLGLVTNQQLVRSIWLGVLIGLVAGGGAIVFAYAIEFATEHLLGTLAGYHPPQPAGEGNPIGDGPSRLWALPFVLGLGGLVAGAIVFTFAPEAEGHGTDAAIDAFHRKGGRVRLRVVPVKLVASAITIGSGGAAGREGPTAQIGSGFGSFIADRLHLGAVERRRAMAAGIGAGIGAIFRAPLGGAMMAVEVLYKHDLEADVILLGLISSIVGYSVYGLWAGWDPIFGGGADFSFTHPQELPYYAALGVVCGLLGILYARAFYGAMDFFKRLSIPRIWKPAIGGFLVGCIGILAPEAIHVGYGTVQQMLTTEGVESFSPWLLLTLPLLRITTTSLSVGSGGSGGIFGPGMVIGGVLGAAAWRFGHGLPGFPAEPGPVVIICMIALFGSVAHAPLAMLLMVGEMTGNLSLLAPAMVAVAIATLVVGETTIYTSQVNTKAESPAHRHRFAFPLLASLPSGRAVHPVSWVPPSTTASRALWLMEAGQARYALVRSDGDLPRELTRDVVERAAAENPDAPVEALARRVPAAVASDAPLDEALDLLAKYERSWLPVRSVEDGEILGAIDARTLVRAYREAARSGVTPLAPYEESGDYLRVPLVASSPAVGRRLAEMAFPAGARVVSISRNGHVLIPEGQTLLEEGDELIVTTPRREQTRVLTLLRGRQ